MRAPELRLIVRRLAGTPLYTLFVVGTLAFGIGLCTAFFSLVEAVFLREFPYSSSDRMVELHGVSPTRSGMRVPFVFVEAIKTRAKSIDAVVTRSPLSGTVKTQSGPVDIRGDRVSTNFVTFFGVRPILGRGFLDTDDSGAPAAIVSEYFWRRYLKADPNVVGTSLQLDDVTYSVVGVMPSTFQTDFGASEHRKHFWTPYVDDATRRLEHDRGYELLGRLARGVTLQSAQRELNALCSTTEAVANLTVRRVGLTPFTDHVVGPAGSTIQFLFAASLIVLLLVVVNVSQLFLAKTDLRLGELMVRHAMGATPLQIAAIVTTEAVFLSVLGGVVGIVVTGYSVPLLVTLAPGDVPRLSGALINWNVVSVCLAITLVTGVAISSAPLFGIQKRLSSRALTDYSFTSRTTVRSWLLMAQATASAMLCYMGVCLSASFVSLLPLDPGFEMNGVATFDVFLPADSYSDARARYNVLEAIARQARDYPGLKVSYASNVPFSKHRTSVIVRDASDVGTVNDRVAEQVGISPSYFSLLEIRMLSGRAFTEVEASSLAPVAIINDALARRLSPNASVLGRRIRVGAPPRVRTYEVIGVANTTRADGLTMETRSELYVPYLHQGTTAPFILLKSHLDDRDATTVIVNAIRNAAPQLPIRDSQMAVSIATLVRRSLAVPRFLGAVAIVFAMSSLLLAVCGAAGLVAYSVSSRRRELGIRCALGGSRWRLRMAAVRPIMGYCLVGVALGTILGVFGCAAVERFSPVEVKGIRVALLTSCLICFAIAIAAYLPARAASKVDPTSLLRNG